MFSAEFPDSLYSITYAERLAWHCLPGAFGERKGYKDAQPPPKAARSGPKSRPLSGTMPSDAVGSLLRTPVNKTIMERMSWEGFMHLERRQLQERREGQLRRTL